MSRSPRSEPTRPCPGEGFSNSSVSATKYNLSAWLADREWQPLRPELVVEVRYDQVTGNRFRHGTKLVRWRPDKGPQQCTFEQLHQETRPGNLIGNLLEKT